MRIAIIPVDMATMRTFRGLNVPQPSTEHSLIKCDLCGRSCWIGPAQRMHYAFNGGELMCYWCVYADMDAGNTDIEIRSLDRTADDKPRRT
jgi:hypothetical protein